MTALDRELIRCEYCNKLRFFAPTVASDGTKLMPLDPLPKPFEPEPTVQPNVILDESGRARVLRKLELADVALGPRYTTHWATCTYSRRMNELREKRRRGRGQKRPAQQPEPEAEEAEL